MKFRNVRRLGISLCWLISLISLTSCQTDPAKGSNEKWLSQNDSQAVIVGENYYMPDFDQNQIMIWNFSDQSLKNWDFFQDAQMPSGKIRRVTSPDASRLAIWTQNEEENTDIYERNPITVNLWNLKEKRVEKQIMATGSGQMQGQDLYWIKDNQLWHQSVDEDSAEMIADLSAEATDANSMSVEAILEHTVIVSADYSVEESSRTYFKIDRDENTLSSFEAEPGDWGEYYSVAYLIGANEEKLYFQIYGSMKIYYFSTDHEGKNAELIQSTNEGTLIRPQPALSQKGFYTIVTNREIGNFDEPRQCQVIRQNGYDKESVATLKCLEELRCTPVGGWLKIQGYSGDGVNHVFLVQPQTGKMFTVAEAKNEYYQSLEEAAMQGIDQPVAFDNEVREARGSSKDPGASLTHFGTALEIQGNAVMISANGKQIQQLNPETGLIEERYALSRSRYPEGRIVKIQNNGGRLFADISWRKEDRMTSTTLILDSATFEVTAEFNDVGNYTVNQDQMIVAQRSDWSVPEEYWLIHLATQNKVKLFDSASLNPKGNYNFYVSSLAYDETKNCLWLTAGYANESYLYQYSLDDQTLLLRARPDQLNTWNEQSFMLFPTADSQFVLGLWQAEDMVGDNFDIYEFDGNHAELIAKDLPSWGDIHLTENGAFTAEYSQWDWNQPYQDINSASYREYSTIYYRSGEEKEELLQLDSSSVQMAYLPASRKLWLRAREESAEYPQELWITYLYDLDSSELRKVNEESFNIYE
ncbi:hypothetical protein DWY25_04105 [Holdemania filiformis]|uniref:Uncharacterized protein n=1 Tax=Holdemania filiformis TaxID=61171 RepID=A0A412G518_9FIRM|nr:hypothetical protein [Holdemania filiformis]RGR75930.1 hypothetical protein DWY25_04105 [Holdemania filiformis]